MRSALQVSVGQFTDKGRKEINQDFHGLLIPEEPLLGTKGIAVALADGIGSSEVSQYASQAAVTGFLYDYYCTAEAWSVKHAVQCVLQATNSWLFAQTRQSQYRYDRDKGYVCTFSALVLKSATAHLFHVGDSRIYLLRDDQVEQLTQDHRFWLSGTQSYLARALGIEQQLEIDYLGFALEPGDVFVLMTDGAYEHVSPGFISAAIRAREDDLDAAANAIVSEALAQGSGDNLTVQIVRVDALPPPGANELCQQLGALPLPPLLEARMEFDGYRIVRPIAISHRSHTWLALDQDSGETILIKTPSTEHREDPDWMARFLLEEWIARRLDNPHVMRPCNVLRKRNYQYIVLEYIEGQTLAQWMRDNPKPDLVTVREIIGQIAKGLQAFHRLEMLHQDLRPENVLIDRTGTVKIVDFGAVSVAGLSELESLPPHAPIPGTEQYAAPEYFLGETGTVQSDVYALGAMTYQMLTGALPYGGRVSRARTLHAQRRLTYEPVRTEARPIPVWVDEAIRKAVHPDPGKRYQEVSEFVYDLCHPNRDFVRKTRPPLMARNPLAFWKALSLILALALVVALFRLYDMR
ncbi:MAG: bifunctional protein-serine/threonine kinase/phosphatase [Betaproteobacteria bacterium]|nr:bifunctional protein-serine/threonine kinase/phosphatase [Betaproteobacteria bacterium]